ncbi:uncharacterized protein VP01_757g4 [Puccinia sorghi]|uniref:Uncharacterized protein n=1 Tax=Puccinia sorghi TaxID=27349 RepID=A0A0L6UBY3_9BASI|nr:uncharacterized protein VP01_757g4 [Puccinia sorghi]
MACNHIEDQERGLDGCRGPLKPLEACWSRRRPKNQNQIFQHKFHLPHLPTIVFQLYAPAIKILAVQMSFNGQSQESICNLLDYSISCQSFKHWMDLFEQTKCLVCDPEIYSNHGKIVTLTSEEIDFVIELVRMEHRLFLSEMRKRCGAYIGEGVAAGLSSCCR